MKMKKRIIGFLASLALVVGMVPTMAFAAGSSSLTIEAADQGRNLELYQIFAGNYDATSNVLSDVVWSTQVTDPTTFINSLKADATLSANSGIAALTTTPTLSSAADVAAALKTVASDSDAAIAFANVAGNYFTQKGVSAMKTLNQGVEQTTGTVKSYAYVFDNLDDGYYLVKDVSTDKDMNSRYIMYVAGNARADLKAVSRPTSDKKMTAVEKSDGTNRPLASATDTYVGIGDTVSYEVTSSVPNMTGYRHYQYVMNDTMSKGLTYNADSLKVTFDKGGANEDELDEGTDYYVETSTDQDTGATTINVIFKDFLNNYKDFAGKKFTYEYTATVNKDAKSGVIGENNEANLTYSNNPDSTHEGDPDKPGPGDVTGETPKQRTYVYTTEVAIIKTDENGQELKGAEFKLTGTNLISKILVGKETFEVAADGTYYKLTDGTYTTTAPTPQTSDKYESTSTKYKATVVLEEKNATAGTITATVDEAGHVVFRGLVQGTYTLEETKAPAGYNKINESMEFTINWARPAADNNPEHKCTWTLTKTNASIIQTDDSANGIFYLKVKNSKGASLPSTGGIGTTIFYVVGGVLMVGALALLITKRRMAKKD